MSTLLLKNKNLQENYKKVCVELADVTEKNKSLEEHIGVLQTQVYMYMYLYMYMCAHFDHAMLHVHGQMYI